MIFRSITLALALAVAARASADTLVQWNFDSASSDANPLTGSWAPSTGTGAFTNVGGTTNYFNTPANGGVAATSDPNTNDNSALRLGSFPSATSSNKNAGIQFFSSTAGFGGIQVSWDQENSATASLYWRAQCTTNGGVTWLDNTVIQAPGSVGWITHHVSDFSAMPNVNNNPNFGFRLASEFQSTATGSGSNNYVGNSSAYGVNGTLWVDMVTVTGTPIPPTALGLRTPYDTLALLTYNVAGGNFDDTPDTWAVTNTRMQNLGAELSALNPDLIGFEEYSVSNTWQLTNFVPAFLPGYYIASNSTTEGGPRNIILSRFPITRSQSWLARTNLTAFGFDGVFTRDLFEAQIQVPWLPHPFHLFDVHLKAFDDATNAPRRAAEARCISNWFVTVYLTGVYKDDPYALMGDMNEDIYKPRDYEQDAIGTLTSAPTGLNLMTPTNPVTGSEKTFDSTNATIRFDYIMPSALFLTNYVTGEVYRSDVSPAFPGVPQDATQTTSDHLPVILRFNNPYAPFAMLSAVFQSSSATLVWQSQISVPYQVEISSDCVHWASLASNLVANSNNYTWTATNLPTTAFLRVSRQSSH